MPPDRASVRTLAGWAVVYVAALLAGLVGFLVEWTLAFGIWGTDEPLQPAAVPAVAVLSLPGALGVVFGYRVNAPQMAAWAVPAVAAGVLALATPVIVEPGRAQYVAFAVLYAFGPVAIGRGLRRLRGRPPRR